MSETKHTPWLYRPNEWDDWGVVRAADGTFVAQACTFNRMTQVELAQHRTNQTDPAEADARLIAAAPDMLEALTALLARFDDNPELSELIGLVEIEHARAVIAKAEGRS